uniref:AT-hook motif nuclear-localized protein n=1 Tax=Kalanchoe fedtschenkoi TaxID=63787 RepID=A0A7N0ZTE9_KALFE
MSKMIEFFQEGPRTICILSATGSVGDFTRKKTIVAGENKKTIVSEETFTHEGPFEIISMSGSWCCMDTDGGRNDKINLKASLIRPDGSMLGGTVAGELIAATDVEILAGSVIVDRNKPNTSVQIASPRPTPAPHMSIGGSGSATPNNPAQLDAVSDSSDDNGGGGGGGGHSLNHTPGPYNDASHPMHGMQMYQAHLDWGSSGVGGMHHIR